MALNSSHSSHSSHSSSIVPSLLTLLVMLVFVLAVILSVFQSHLITWPWSVQSPMTLVFRGAVPLFQFQNSTFAATTADAWIGIDIDVHSTKISPNHGGEQSIVISHGTQLTLLMRTSKHGLENHSDQQYDGDNDNETIQTMFTSMTRESGEQHTGRALAIRRVNDVRIAQPTPPASLINIAQVTSAGKVTMYDGNIRKKWHNTDIIMTMMMESTTTSTATQTPAIIEEAMLLFIDKDTNEEQHEHEHGLVVAMKNQHNHAWDYQRIDINDGHTIWKTHEATATWRMCTQDITMQILPHQWNDIQDTLLETKNIMHTKRKNRKTGVDEQVDLQETRARKVVVAHIEDGIEVVEIENGRPLCRVDAQPHILHVDLDDDGVIERVERGLTASDENSDEKERKHHQLDAGQCIVKTTSGTNYELFTNNVCRREWDVLKERMQRTINGESDADTGRFKAALVSPPALMLESLYSHTGRLFAELLAKMRRTVDIDHMDIKQKCCSGQAYSVNGHCKCNWQMWFFTSSGLVTGFDHAGHVVGHVQTNSRFTHLFNSEDEMSELLELRSHLDPAMLDFIENDDFDPSESLKEILTFDPRLVPMALQVDDPYDHLIAQSPNYISIISIDGTLRTQIRLRSLPILPAIPFDFDGDSKTDILLLTEFGLECYTFSDNLISNYAMASVLLCIAAVAVLLILVLNDEKKRRILKPTTGSSDKSLLRPVIRPSLRTTHIKQF